VGVAAKYVTFVSTGRDSHFRRQPSCLLLHVGVAAKYLTSVSTGSIGG
jgi:hypothetical protein